MAWEVARRTSDLSAGGSPRLLLEFDRWLGLDLATAIPPEEPPGERPAHRRPGGEAPGGARQQGLGRGGPDPRGAAGRGRGDRGHARGAALEARVSGERFELVSEFEPKGRPAARDLRAGPGIREGGAAPDPAGSHRQRKVLHHGLRGRRAEPAHPGDGAQQDPGGPALRRVQGALSRKRRRVLRLLLRLLPARGLHPGRRHLHREGLVDQRRDRQAAPLRHPLAADPARRAGGGERLLHLRAGCARDLRLHARLRRDRHAPDARRPAAPPRRHALRAQRPRLPPRHLPGARRRGRDLSPVRERAGAARRVLRRRGRGDRRDRPAARARSWRGRSGR